MDWGDITDNYHKPKGYDVSRLRLRRGGPRSEGFTAPALLQGLTWVQWWCWTLMRRQHSLVALVWGQVGCPALIPNMLLSCFYWTFWKQCLCVKEWFTMTSAVTVQICFVWFIPDCTVNFALFPPQSPCVHHLYCTVWKLHVTVNLILTGHFWKPQFTWVILVSIVGMK